MGNYSIKVLEFGYDENFPLGIAFDMWDKAEVKAYSSFSMTLIQGEGHNILYDSGIDLSKEFVKKKIEIENDKNCHNPNDVLQTVGLKVEDIDTVIISHAHWDHMSGLNFYPNAKFYIQKDEYESWKRAMDDPDFPNTYKMVVDYDSILELEKLMENGRVELFNGDVKEFLPGLSVVKASGHSFAQNLLFIESNGEKYAFISDCAMRPESFEKKEPFFSFLPNVKFAVGKIEDIIESYKKILKYVDNDITHIFTMHNGDVAKNWETSRSELGLNVTKVCDYR